MTSERIDERSRRRAALMAAVQGGDANSYAELLNEIGPMVASFLRRRVRHAEDREDLYQDVLMTLHRARHTYDPSRPLEPWLFAIARHVVGEHERRRSTRRGREVLVATAPESVAAGEGDARVQLEQALRALSPDQREAITLLRVERLSLDAAALRARTTRGALKVRAHRAYKLLRERLLFS